jgi:hypothetical protein
LIDSVLELNKLRAFHFNSAINIAFTEIHSIPTVEINVFQEISSITSRAIQRL